MPSPPQWTRPRWLWSPSWATLPAVVDPGSADEPAANDGGACQRQPELHDQPSALSAPAQLAVLVTPGMGALDHPPAGDLDRCRDTPRGDLANHPAFGQDLSAGLPVVASIQVHDWLGGQRADPTYGIQGRR